MSFRQKNQLINFRKKVKVVSLFLPLGVIQHELRGQHNFRFAREGDIFFGKKRKHENPLEGRSKANNVRNDVRTTH